MTLPTSSAIPGGRAIELENLGLIVNVDTTDSDEPQGTVIDQDPGAGTALPRGDPVTLVVSTGAGSVLVPDVVGQPQEAARSRT